jgi:FkbM family methyltransferase
MCWIHALLGRFLIKHVQTFIRNIATESWKPFLLKQLSDRESSFQCIEERLIILKRGLDHQSCQEIDQYLYRVIFATFADQTNTFINRSHWNYILNPTECNSYKTIVDFPDYKKIIKDFGLSFDDISGLTYNNGLSYIPKEVTDQLAGKDFIDGGSFTGDSVLSFVKYNPRNIYCFEPGKENFSKLNTNIKKHNWNNVVPIPQGLGIARERLHITGTKGSGLKVSRESNGVGVDIVDIDFFVTQHNLKLGLIKLDVEGFEWNVIQGSLESIKKYKPILLISIYHNPHDFFEIKPFIEQMEIGYQFLVRKIVPAVPYRETILICYPPK